MSIEETLIKEKECDSVSIYISIICFLHGHLFRCGLLRSQSSYPDISAASCGSMTSWRNIIWSPRPTLCRKATSNDERGAEFLNQGNSVYQNFKSIATSTARNCTLYSVKWKALLVPLQPLKEIIPHYSYHVPEPHPRCMHRTGKRCPETLQLASLRSDTVLTALPSVHILKHEDQERNRSFRSLFISVEISHAFLRISDQFWNGRLTTCRGFRDSFKDVKVTLNILEGAKDIGVPHSNLHWTQTRPSHWASRI